MMLILALAEQRAGRLAGDTVVATVMSNIGLEIALRKHGIRLLRAPVGDKYVMDAMVQGGYVIGGEQSGHVILASHLPTGDGLATALAVLAVMADTGRELGDLARELVTYPQTLVNVRVRERTPVASVPGLVRGGQLCGHEEQGRRGGPDGRPPARRATPAHDSSPRAGTRSWVKAPATDAASSR